MLARIFHDRTTLSLEPKKNKKNRTAQSESYLRVFTFEERFKNAHRLETADPLLIFLEQSPIELNPIYS